MSSLDFWKQVKESREILKKNKVENYQTLTISDGIFNMLYEEAEVLEIIREKVMPLVHIDQDGVWDNELYEHKHLSIDQYAKLIKFKQGKK